MKKEVFREIKREFVFIGILFIIFLIIFKILFYKENFLTVFKTVFALFWLFVLPGYAIMFYWNKKLGFTERFIIGIALAAGVIGIFSYYLGLIGLNIKYHIVLLPLVLISIGIAINLRK